MQIKTHRITGERKSHAVALAALLLALGGAAQANTVTLSNGTNSAAIPTGVTDIFNIPGVGVTSGGTLILDNYQLFGNQANGNANCGFGLGSNNNTFTLTNGSFFAFGGTTYPAGYGNTGFGSPLNWGAAGGGWQGGGGTTSNNVLNIQTGSTLAIGRRFCWANNITNRVNVDGAGSKFINSNPSNTNPVGGTWAITNGGSVFMANVGYSASTTFNATIGGTDPSGYGSTWHSVGGFNGLNNAANIVTINSGGFLEFENLTPVFSIGSGAVNISGGGLSYGLPQNGAAYSGDLLGSNAGSAANTIGGFTWSGFNRFRINGGAAGITDNGGTAYTFANNLGAKNYYALDLVGTAAISRAITFDGDNGGSMKVSGATASLSGGVTLSGTTAVSVTALGTASTLNGAIGGGGSLAKDGTGSLTIADSMIAYTGDTLVNAGTLNIGNNSLSNSGAVKVASGAILNLNTGISDTVGSVWYNGVNLGAGTYTAGSYPWLTGSGSLVVTGGGATIDHYDVSAPALQTAGTPFTVTVTAKDSGGSTVNDSATVVTMTGTGGVVFDSDGNGTFGDNTKTLASGTFTISAKTNSAGSVTLTATDATPKTGNSSLITVQSQFAAHMGGQPGVPSGKEGFNADANSDCVDNGLAWILGGAAMTNSTALLPQGTLDSGYLKLFNFKALKAGKRLDTTLSVHYSSDLGISDFWHAASVPSAYGVNIVNDVRFTVSDNGDDYDTIIAEIPQSKALGGSTLYGRLEATGQ